MWLLLFCVWCAVLSSRSWILWLLLVPRNVGWSVSPCILAHFTWVYSSFLLSILIALLSIHIALLGIHTPFLCPSDCVYTRTVVSIHTDLMSIHIAPAVYTTDEYTHRSEIVHIGQTLYTSVENCTHRSKNVHIDLKNYTSIWKTTHPNSTIHIHCTVYTQWGYYSYSVDHLR